MDDNETPYTYDSSPSSFDKNSPWLTNGSTEFLARPQGSIGGYDFHFLFSFQCLKSEAFFLKVSAKGTVFFEPRAFFLFFIFFNFSILFSTDLLPNKITINIYYLTHRYLLVQSKFKGTIHAWRLETLSLSTFVHS